MHALVLLALWLHRDPAVAPEPPPSSEVAVVFDNPSGPLPASTASLQPAPVPQASLGNPDAPVAPPTQDTDAPAAAAPAEPPTTEAPDPAATPSPPVVEPAPAPPPTVSLRSDDFSFQLPPFTPPQPPLPLPLPPLPPRAPAPRPVVRPPARPASPFSNPQDWSLNGSARPSPRSGSASRGFDFGVKQQGGSSEADMSYVAGARPSGDWNSAIRRWAQARIYYPEQAAANGEEGVAGVLVEIDRSGHVLSVRLEQSAHSPFLDGAWVDIWRNAHVPPFTPDMTEPTTTIRFNLYYHLIRR